MPLTTTDTPITRGTLAKRFGCHLETVRYYEKIGLLHAPAHYLRNELLGNSSLRR